MTRADGPLLVETGLIYPQFITMMVCGSRRGVLVELTDDGLALRHAVASVPFRLASQLDLDPEEFSGLLGQLQQLARTLDSAALETATLETDQS